MAFISRASLPYGVSKVTCLPQRRVPRPQRLPRRRRHPMRLAKVAHTTSAAWLRLGGRFVSWRRRRPALSSRPPAIVQLCCQSRVPQELLVGRTYFLPMVIGAFGLFSTFRDRQKQSPLRARDGNEVGRAFRV